MRHRPNYSVFRKPTGGFTLVELLVVISIIALLMAILMPSLNKVRAMGKQLVCAQQFKQAGLAIQLYSQDNNGYPAYLGKNNPFSGPGVDYDNIYRNGNDHNVITYQLANGKYLPYENKDASGAYTGISALECTEGAFGPLRSHGYPPDTFGVSNVGEMDYMYFAFGDEYKSDWAARSYKKAKSYQLLMQDRYCQSNGFLGTDNFDWANHKQRGANALYADYHVQWWHARDMVKYGPISSVVVYWKLATKYYSPP